MISDHSLRQFDEIYIRSLPEKACQDLAVKLLADLKISRERQNQNPNNSSMPPSSRLPWERSETSGSEPKDNMDEDAADRDEPKQKTTSPKEQVSSGEGEKLGGGTRPAKRSPGKQPGAPGYGRTQQLPVTDTVEHHALCCGGCGHTAEKDKRVAWAGFYTIDVEVGTPGIGVTNTKHIYYDLICPCGHVTRKYPYQEVNDALWEGVELSERRLVGPMLCALIISLAYRMRMSRTKIREFLHDWLDIQLSTGTIQRCVEESARACVPVEDQLVEEVLKSELLHVDETPHKEKKTLLWLWVFATRFSALYFIGYRSAEIIENLLGQSYSGWLMSDGYRVYRKYASRLRCWAHLVRKAKGLEESLNSEGRYFGERVHEILKTLMNAVYEAREGPPPEDLKQIPCAAAGGVSRSMRNHESIIACKNP